MMPWEKPMKLLIACLEHDHIYRRDEPQITPFGNNSPCLFKGSLNLFLLSKKRGKCKDRDCRVKGWGGGGGMGEGGEEGRASSSVPSSVSLPQTEYTLISSLNLPEKFQHPKKKNTDYRRPYANRIHAAQTKIQMTKESTLRNNFAHCMTELLRNFATVCHERHMTYLKTGLYR